MSSYATLTLAAVRNEIARFTIVVEGLDLTGVAMAMQVRLGPDTPGAPQFSLATVDSLAAEGLKLDSVTFTDGVPTSTIKGRINASTMSDATKVPYSGELGSDSTFAYAMQWTIGGDARTRLRGDFIVLASAFGSDNAPVDRPDAGARSFRQADTDGGTLTFGDQIVHVSIDGATVLNALTDQTEAAADAAMAARDAAVGAAASYLLPTEFKNGALDPDLPGPFYDYGSGDGLTSEASDAAFANAGLPHMINIANKEVYLNLDPATPVAVGSWVAAAVAIRISDASQWATLEGKMRLIVNRVGGDASAQTLAPIVAHDDLDATHRVYRIVYQNPYQALLDRVSIRLSLLGASFVIHFAGQAVATSHAQPIGVQWRIADPLGVAAVAQRVARVTPSDSDIVMLSDSLGVQVVAPLGARTGRKVYDWGIGGQRSTQIVNRALGVTLRIANNQIVSGSNAVSHVNGVALADSPNGDISHRILSGAGNEFAITGYAGSIHGRLRAVSGDGGTTFSYAFTPDSRQTLPVIFPLDTPFVPDFPEGATVVYIAGRNNFYANAGHPDYGATRILEDLRRLMAVYPRVLVLAVANGDLNGTSEYGPDGGYYLEIAALNGRIAAAAGRHFLDHVRATKDRGLALAGLTADAQSNVDKSHDVPSHQLRSDPLHQNTAGADVHAQLIAAKLLELGW